MDGAGAEDRLGAGELVGAVLRAGAEGAFDAHLAQAAGEALEAGLVGDAEEGALDSVCQLVLSGPPGPEGDEVEGVRPLGGKPSF